MIDEKKAREYLQRYYIKSKLTFRYYNLILSAFLKYNHYETVAEQLNQYFSRYTNNTINRSAIKAIFKSQDIKQEILPPKTNPMEKIRRFLTKEDVDFLITHTTEKNSLIILIMWETGLRLREAIDIRISEIDKEERTISGMGKGNKEFCEGISKKTMDRIDEFVKNNPPSEGDYIFHYERIKHHSKKFYCELRKEATPLGFPYIHPHLIRHALGNYLHNVLNFPIAQVKLKLRHKDITTTQIYAIADMSELRKRIKKEIFGEDQ